MEQAVILNPQELERFRAGVVDDICQRLERKFKREPDKPLTTKEAASYLSIKPKTLLGKCKTGEIKGVKRGSMWYFKETDLISYIDGKKK